jgi:multidrug resistance efflux pump
MTTTNSHTPNNPPTLQVVPPNKVQPTSAPVNPNKETASVPTVEKSSSIYQWLLTLIFLLGIGSLGLVKIPQSVSGTAEITSTPTARQTLTMPMSGRIKEILIRPNQSVETKQPLAILESEELEKDIAQAKKEVEQAQSEVALTQQQLAPLEAQVNQALTQVTASRQKADFLQQQLTQLKQGTPPPEIQKFSSEIDGIKSEISGLKEELKLVEDQLIQYQKFSKDGIIPQKYITDTKQQHIVLAKQIAEKNHQIEAKIAQIDTVKQNLGQELEQQQAEVNQKLAAVNGAMEQVKQGAANVKIRQEMAMKIGTELVRQQERLKELSPLRATTSGTVITPDLDKLQNQYLQAGAKVLELIDLNQLTTTVQIKPEDAPLVHKGATVTFRPQSTGLLSYTGKVQETNIDSVVFSDGVQQPPRVTVRVLLNQQDNLLRPGLKGYAHIEAESLPLYQKLQQEFVKLVPVGKFF